MSTPPDYWLCFSTSYAQSRTRFIAAAQSANARLAQYVHPYEKEPNGSSLSVDVAILGRIDAPRQLLALSGTHGLEGPAGAAVQIAWLGSEQAKALPEDVAVILVHAINPYGWAYQTRTTENNVDLNRNFVDHDLPYPPNPLYAELHSWLTPEEWSEASLKEQRQALDAFREKYGADELFETTARGQYTHPQGVIYGGSQREWSNTVLETLITEHMSHAHKVAFIDWHTGIGDFGQPFFLCFNDDGSEEQEQAAKWWGRETILDQRPHGLARPNYQGLVFQGAQRFLAQAKLAGAVVEFGTRGINMRQALYLDQWLRFHAKRHPDAQRDELLRADLLDAFVPLSSVWRRSALEHGLRITRQAIDGLAHW